jgi:hypothetical protein
VVLDQLVVERIAQEHLELSDGAMQRGGRLVAREHRHAHVLRIVGGHLVRGMYILFTYVLSAGGSRGSRPVTVAAIDGSSVHCQWGAMALCTVRIVLTSAVASAANTGWPGCRSTSRRASAPPATIGIGRGREW